MEGTGGGGPDSEHSVQARTLPGAGIPPLTPHPGEPPEDSPTPWLGLRPGIQGVLNIPGTWGPQERLCV